MKSPETQAAKPARTEASVAQAVRTAVEMKVAGVLSIGTGEDRRSSAIITLKGGEKGRAYSPGQTIAGNPELKLVRVRNERIEFLNQGRLEFAPVKTFPDADGGGSSSYSQVDPENRSVRPPPRGGLNHAPDASSEDDLDIAEPAAGDEDGQQP